ASVRGYAAKSSLGPNCVGLTKTLATTRSHSFAASAARLRWPSCRLPIVGTKPTRSLRARHPPTASRISATVRTVTRSRALTEDTPATLETSRACPSRRERVLLGRITAVFDGEHVGTQSVEHGIAAAHEVLHEARHPPLGDAEDVVEHEDLPIDRGAGA